MSEAGAGAVEVDEGRLASLRAHLSRQPVVEVEAGERRLRLVSRHGLFSARRLDDGTELLLRALEPLPPQPRCLDLGCGYGALGLSLAVRWPSSRVDLVDVDVRAVSAAAENIAGNGLENAAALLSDGIEAVREQGLAYDLVVANLPAQAGNDALDALLLDAYDALRLDGLLVVVAVNGLRRYLLRRLGDIFGAEQAGKVRQGSRHTVLEAVRVSA